MFLWSSLLRIHYYHNKRLQVNEFQHLILTYSWIFTPIPNWTCSVMKISHFQCTTPNTWLTNRCTNPSTWLTTNLRRMLAAKVFQFINTMKITKLFGYKPLWCTNIAVFSRERWTRTYVSSHNMLAITSATTLWQS